MRKFGITLAVVGIIAAVATYLYRKAQQELYALIPDETEDEE